MIVCHLKQVAVESVHEWDLFTSDKANSTFQVDAKRITDNRHFRKKKKLSYAEVLLKGKDINNPKIESTITETLKITQNECAIDLHY